MKLVPKLPHPWYIRARENRAYARFSLAFMQRTAVSDIGETWVITGICVFFFFFGVLTP